MAKLENLDNINIKRLKELVDELTVRDERVMREHELFDKIIRLVLDGVWIVDEDNLTTFVNDKMASMLGYTSDEMVGQDVSKYMDEEGKKIAANNFIRRRSGIEEMHFFKFIKKNGETIITQVSAAPIMGPRKKYKGSIAYIKEVNDKEFSNFYKDMFFKISPDAILIVDFDGCIKDINDEYLKLIGAKKKDDVIGKHFLDFVTKDTFNNSIEAFEFIKAGNELLKFKNKIKNSFKEETEISWRAKPSIENGLIFATGRRVIL